MVKLPDEIKNLKHWTPHHNKRPALAPNQWEQGMSYDEVKEQTEHYGLLVAPATETPYLFIDVDYPDEVAEGTLSKEQVVQQMVKEGVDWGSERHFELIEPTMASIRETSLYPLITQTYTEFSPSGTGLRMIVRSEDKGRFKRAYKKAVTFKGQIDFKNQFITITERGFPGSVSKIKEVPLMRMADAFGFKTKQEQVIPNVEDAFNKLMGESDNMTMPMSDMPNPIQMAKALKSIPLDQNERIKKVWFDVTGEQYEHYNFWLSIGMALHDYSKHVKKPSQVYLAYLEWSESDPTSYTGEEDVSNKWSSFESKGDSDITWRTILKIANMCVFEYPRPIITAKGVNTGRPMINEWVNFEYLLNYYNLKLHEDDGFYVSGDKDICDKYFTMHGAQCWFDKYYGPLSMPGLLAATLMLCQDSRWRGLSSTKYLVQTWIAQPRAEMDLFQIWLDTPYEELPLEFRTVSTTRGYRDAATYNSNSNVDYIFEMLNVQYTDPTERALAKVMLKKTLMQMIKFREPLTLPFTDNGGMLILIGAENTYKSTFFKLLLPQPLSNLRKEVNMQIRGEKSVRDFVRNLGQKTIVQIDEFEGMMDHSAQGSLFKAIISGDDASMTDIYQTTETKMQRKAIIVGTSNETRQVISDNGSRRMWFVQVNQINTDGMLQINLHKLYNDLREEFKVRYNNGEMPWLLTQQEINVLYGMNMSLAAKSDIAIWLDTIWPTYIPMPEWYMEDVTSVQTDRSGKLLSTQEVLNTLKLKGMPSQVKLPALERALERHCGQWTDTLNKSKQLKKPRAEFSNGQLLQGTTRSGSPKYKKWVMPPMSDADSLPIDDRPVNAIEAEVQSELKGDSEEARAERRVSEAEERVRLLEEELNRAKAAIAKERIETEDPIDPESLW